MLENGVLNMKKYKWLKNTALGLFGAVQLFSASPALAEDKSNFVFNKGYNTVEVGTSTGPDRTYRLTTNNSVDFENVRLTHNGINNYSDKTGKIIGANRLSIGPNYSDWKVVGVYKPGAKIGSLKGGLRYEVSKTGFFDLVTDGKSIEGTLVYPVVLTRDEGGKPSFRGRAIVGANHHLSGKRTGKTDATAEIQLNQMLDNGWFIYGRLNMTSGNSPVYGAGVGVEF